MSSLEGNGRITVSEDKLNAALAGLELRVVDRITTALEVKADQVEIDGMRARLHTAEATISATAFVLPLVQDTEKRVTALERFRYAVPGAAVLSAAAALFLAITSHHL